MTEAAFEPFGRYFEEFEAGAVYQHWPGKTVTEYDHHLYCLLTMNQHPAHIDAHHAESNIRGKKNPVITGYLFALLLGMSVRDLTGRAIRHRDGGVEHTAPVFHGDTVYGESVVLEKEDVEDRPDRGLVRVETYGRTQDGTRFLRFHREIVVWREAFAPAHVRGAGHPTAQGHL